RGLVAGGGDLGLAAGVGAEVPGEADEARADALGLDDGRARVVDGGARVEARQPAAHERPRRLLEPLLLLEERDEDGVRGARQAERLLGRRQRGPLTDVHYVGPRVDRE